MLKDMILIGVLVGILADAVKLTFNYMAFLLNLTNVVFWQITATRFLEKGDLFKPVTYIIGGIADITVTAVLGVIFIYFIYFIGKDNLWFKGMGFGLVVWVGLFGTLLGESVRAKLPQTPSGILVTIAAHFFFGLGLAFFTRLFYRVGNEKSSKEGKAIYRFVPLPVKKIIHHELEKNNNSYKKVKLKKPTKL